MNVKRNLILAVSIVCATLNGYAQCPSPQLNAQSSICPGATANVVLQGDGLYAYQLYKNGNAIGSSQSNSSGIIIWPGMGTGSYYAVRVSGCGSYTSNTKTITSVSAGSISISTGGTQPNICSGNSITLTPQGGSNYSWSASPSDANAAGSGAITVHPATNTTYTLSGTESTCNTTVTSSILISVYPKVGQVTLGGGYTFCQGTVASTNLTASTPANVSSYSWNITSGAGTVSGSTANTTVTWNSSFSGPATITVTAFSPNGCNYITQASTTFTINPVPGQPTITSPINALYNSTYTLSSSASGAGTNETYKWYASDGSPYSSTTTPPLNVGTPYTYYATKYNTVTTCETPFASKVPLTINLYLDPPTPVTVTPNSCSSKSVTGSAPANVTYYLQTDPNGRLTTSPLTGTGAIISTSGQYYVNASANTFSLWSTSVPLSLTTTTINPVDISIPVYDMNQNNTVVLASHSIKLTPGFYVPQGSTFDAAIAISSECNSLYNWDEGIAYDENGIVIGDSRRYYDGFGTTLENQTKNISGGVVFASQTIKDSYSNPVLTSLAAPILENDFIYKDALLTNSSNQPYSYSDFEGAKQNNPTPAGNQAGTIGNYYSSLNTTEPNTPVTNYPFANSYTPPGPNPLTSKAAGAGDAYRMGSGHEVKTDKSYFTVSELSHYYSLRSFFSLFSYYSVTTPLTISSPITSTLLFPSYQSATIGASSPYVTITSTASGTPGAYPINNSSFTVTPGTICNLIVTGYKSGAGLAKLQIADQNGANLAWGGTLPSDYPGTVNLSYTVPSSGVTAIKVGVQWFTPSSGSIAS